MHLVSPPRPASQHSGPPHSSYGVLRSSEATSATSRCPQPLGRSHAFCPWRLSLPLLLAALCWATPGLKSTVSGWYWCPGGTPPAQLCSRKTFLGPRRLLCLDEGSLDLQQEKQMGEGRGLCWVLSRAFPVVPHPNKSLFGVRTPKSVPLWLLGQHILCLQAPPQHTSLKIFFDFSRKLCCPWAGSSNQGRFLSL